MAARDYASPIVIVGAGVFGLSTALELAKRGYLDISVFDRSAPPVADGSSVDVSRVIRWDYTDPFYADLARAAMDEWRSDQWKTYYHNTGFVLSSEDGVDPYIQECRRRLNEEGHDITQFDDSGELINHFPVFKQSGIGQLGGYINPIGGWADAEGAIKHLAHLCETSGVKFVTGARGTVKSLVIEDSRVVGIKTAAGTTRCNRVLLATGAWTNRLINIQSSMSSSGQPVGFIQLSSEEAQSLEKMPVLINLTSGFFIFPPTPETHLLKVARHCHGFEGSVKTLDGRTISAPKLEGVGAADFIPEDAEQALRNGLRYILPQFANRPWSRRRLCWYSDTPEGNFVVDRHPSLPGLFIAAGGAGHAYKFLPVLGKHIVDCIEQKASTEMRERWALKLSDQGEMVCNDGSRRGPPRRLLTNMEQARL